jgi:hypothetical protein
MVHTEEQYLERFSLPQPGHDWSGIPYQLSLKYNLKQDSYGATYFRF